MRMATLHMIQLAADNAFQRIYKHAYSEMLSFNLSNFISLISERKVLLKRRGKLIQVGANEASWFKYWVLKRVEKKCPLIR